MIEIRLTPAELMTVGWIASGRRFETAKRGAQHYGDHQRNFESEFIGVKGEIAFRRVTGLPWSENSAPFDTDFPGYEIKTRSVLTGRDLFLKYKDIDGPDKKPPSTIYVLAWTLFDHSIVKLVGWHRLDHIANHPKAQDVNKHLCLPYRELRSMEDLPCLTRC
jgi:hypothetical protein